MITLSFGTEGFGTYAVMLGLLDLYSSIGLLGLSTTGGTFLSSSAKKEYNQSAIFNYYIILSTLTIIFYLASYRYALTIFYGDISISHLSFLILPIVFNQFTVFCQILLQGSLEFGVLRKISFISSVLMTIMLVLLLYFDIHNMVIVFWILYSAGFLVNFLYLNKLKFKLVWIPIRSLFLLLKQPVIIAGLYLVASSAASDIINTIFRGLILKKYGLGIFSGYMALSTVLYSNFFVLMGAVLLEFLPTAKQKTEKYSFGKLVADYTKVGLSFFTPLLILFNIVGLQILKVLYNGEISIIVGPFMSLVVFGFYFKIISYIMALGILSKGRNVLYLFLEIISSSLNLLILRCLNISDASLLGYIFLIVNFCYALTLYLLIRRHMDIQSYSNVFKSFVISFLILIIFYLGSFFIPVYFSLFFLFILFLYIFYYYYGAAQNLVL